jgi:type VI secretion system secreted protein VgrG
MSISRKAIPKQVFVNDDHYPNAQDDMTAVTAVNPDYPALVAEAYRWGENYPEAGNVYQTEPGQGMWYAKRRQERYLSEQITFEGQSNCMTLRPGMVITTPGKDWPEAPDGLLIVSTASQHVARDTAYIITFTAVPRHSQYAYRPPLLPWPPVFLALTQTNLTHILTTRGYTALNLGLIARNGRRDLKAVGYG